MSEKFCQSCGMPIKDSEMLGNEKDGTKNQDYCIYCYDNGQFTQEDINMEQMIENCLPFMKEHGMKEDYARSLLNENLPTLKRWQKNNESD